MVCCVLALHRVSPRCFNLSGLRPASVRDQLLRSTLIVRSLLNEGLIRRDQKNRGLLIYGAGAAGMNAAMEASRLGVHVTVVEKSDIQRPASEPEDARRLFPTFSHCMSRRINATEYDWPHKNWQQGKFLECSLPQASPTAAYLQAAVWRAAWTSFAVNKNGRDGFGLISLIDKLDASDFRVIHGPDAELTIHGPWPDEGQSQKKFRTFGALISCIGIGAETVTLEGIPFSGPSFWSDADGIFPGMPLPEHYTHVVISGGGDGAMQDLQRVATSYHGGSLYERVESCLSPKEMPDHQLRADLLSADETGRRTYCWAGTEKAKLAVATRWHQSIKECVSDFFERKWSAETFERLAKNLFRQQLEGKKPLQITWVIRERTPGPSYVLNRFLVLLLIELSKRGPQGQCIFDKYSTRIWGIESDETGHVCGSNGPCVGKKHTVMIGPVAGNSATAEQVSANLIMIRHGLTSAPVLNGSAPVTDQILPHSLP